MNSPTNTGSPDSTPATASEAAPSAGPIVAFEQSGGPGVRAFVVLIIIAAVGIAIDLWSKHWAFHELRQCNKPVVVVPYVLEFQTMLNTGALFGIGAGQTTLFLVASVLALGLVTWMFLQTTRRQWGLHIALAAILAGALGNMFDRVFVKLDRVAEPVAVRFDHDGKIIAGRCAVFVEYVGPFEDRHQYEEYPRGLGGAIVMRDRPPEEVGCVRDFIKIPTRWKLFGKEGDLWPWVFNVADMLLVGGVSILAIHLLRERKHPPHDTAATAA